LSTHRRLGIYGAAMDDAQLDLLAARQAITEVIHRYCRGVDRMDRALTLSVWHPGGGADYTPWYEGDVAGLVDYLWAAHATVAAHAHQIHNLVIEVDGNHAVSEAYFTAVLRLERPDGRLLDRAVRGRYLDRWSCRGGVWAIDQRRVVQDLESVTEVRTTGKTDGAARRGRDDPSYELFSG
jgi:hypothetical protein